MADTADNMENRLLNRALDVLRGITTKQIKLTVLAPPATRQHVPDALVQLTAPGVRRQFAVEVKPRLTPATLALATQQLQHFRHKGLLVTDYVNPDMAERLRAMDMAFVDLAGNAYLNEPPVFIYIKGNRPPERAEQRAPARAFQTTGLKIVFALLHKPALAAAPYREIAKTADVALGTVGRVINDLKALGFLVDRGQRGRQLVQREKLLARWVTAYPEKLRPKLLQGYYQADDPDWWVNAAPEKYQACWGGEVAAARLTGYLKPATATLYTWQNPAELLLHHRLRKQPGGNVEVLRAFWKNGEALPRTGLAPALLVYADLMATGEPRNIKTARMLYEQEVAGLVRDD